MQKIPTLFVRDPENRKLVTAEVAVDLPAHAIPTPKFDGTCVGYNGAAWWARREVKPGKPTPDEFVAVSTDPTTGKTMGWVPIDADNPEWKHHTTAIANYLSEWGTVSSDGTMYTFEAVGPHFQGNPHGFHGDFLIRHGAARLRDVPVDFDGLRDYLDRAGTLAVPHEGVVWWVDGNPAAKIKRRDFDLPWPPR